MSVISDAVGDGGGKGGIRGEVSLHARYAPDGDVDNTDDDKIEAVEEDINLSEVLNEFFESDSNASNQSKGNPLSNAAFGSSGVALSTASINACDIKSLIMEIKNAGCFTERTDNFCATIISHPDLMSSGLQICPTMKGKKQFLMFLNEVCWYDI